MVSNRTIRTGSGEAPAGDATAAEPPGWGTFEAPGFGTLWLVFGALGLEPRSRDRLADAYHELETGQLDGRLRWTEVGGAPATTSSHAAAEVAG